MPREGVTDFSRWAIPWFIPQDRYASKVLPGRPVTQPGSRVAGLAGSRDNRTVGGCTP